MLNIQVITNTPLIVFINKTMQNHTKTTEKVWTVAENGQMTYFVDGKIMFDIEPETLKDKDKFYFLSLMPEIDEYYFFTNWIKACKNAKIKEMIITLAK